MLLSQQASKNLVQSWKDRIIVCERAVLYTIGFNLILHHPYKAMAAMTSAVRGWSAPYVLALVGC